MGHGVICHPRFFQRVHRKKIQAKRGQIARIRPTGEVELDDGSLIKADEIVFATGFQRVFDFLPKELLDKKEADGFFSYKHMLVPGVPDIAFLNSNVTTFSNITTPGIQARWLTEVIKGNVTLPSNSEIEAIVEREKAWRRDHLKHAGSARAYLIQLHQTRYWDSLLIDMGANVKRKHSCLGPVVSALQQFFAPVVSKDYKTIVTGEWKSNPREVRALGYKPSWAFEWINLLLFIAIPVALGVYFGIYHE